MNKQPISYLQTDPRWKSKPYQVKGETTTIGASGCGPTAAAMLIETLTGKTFTPADACAWSLAHGYKALKAGTYFGYFKPQFADKGIKCDMLNWTNTYGKPDHANHKKVEEMLKQGYYFIAVMGPGTWTNGGHFVVLWWQDGKMRINDPASKKEIRLNGDIRTFRSQVKYYWWIDAREYNKNGKAISDNPTPVVSAPFPGCKLKVGDIVEFTGCQHYFSANTSRPSPCQPGKAKVTQVYNGKHPYQLIAVKGGGSTVYGWVDEKDIKIMDGKDELNMDIKEARTQLTTCTGTGDTPSGWAKEATEYCKKAGIFNGDGAGNYGWQQPITREAVAQIIYNVLERAGMLDKLDG